MANYGKLFNVRTPDPNSFVSRTPDVTGAVDPYTAAATALTQGLMQGEQVMRDRMEADRAYALQKQALRQSSDQFQESHDLNEREVENMMTRHRDGQALAKRGMDLEDEMWEVERAVIEQQQEADALRLGEAKRVVNRNREWERRFDAISGRVTTYGQQTRYGASHDDKYLDTNTKNGIGHASNKLVPNMSVALGKKAKAQLGIDGKEDAELEVQFPDGSTRRFNSHDTIHSMFDEEIRLDIYDPSGKEQFDGADVQIRRVDGSKGSFSMGEASGYASVVRDQGPQVPAQDDGSVQQFEQLEQIVQAPDAPDDVKARALHQMQRLEQVPTVIKELNRRDGHRLANTVLVGEMMGSVKQAFLDHVNGQDFRMTPQEMQATAEQFVKNEIAMAPNTDFNKPIAETLKQTTALANAVSDMVMLEDAFSALDDGDVGRIQGPFKGLLDKVHENKGRARVNALINSVLPNLARGVFREVGVLTDTDMERYRSTIPSFKDSKALQQDILDTLRSKLSMQIRSDILAADTIRREDPKAIRDFYGSTGINVDHVLRGGIVGSGGAHTISTGGSTLKVVTNPDGSQSVVEESTPQAVTEEKVARASDANQRAAEQSQRVFDEQRRVKRGNHRS